MTIAIRTLLAAALGLCLVFGLIPSGVEKLFEKQVVILLAFLLPPAMLVGILWKRTGGPSTRRLRYYAPEVLLAGCMLLALVSSFPLHHWFFFLRWRPEQVGLYTSGLVRLILWTTLLTPLFLFKVRKLWIALFLVLVVCQVMCFQSLLEGTGGAALYRTDHPSFMFRLFEFSRTFPQLVNYNPYWNGGSLHFVGVVSGTAAPGLLLWPLWRWFAIHEVYTYGVGFLFIVLIPWIAAGSIRAMGGDRTGMAAGGLLALGVSQHFFLWMLHFGTIGSATAGAMILPVAALSFRVVWLDQRERTVGVLLVAAAFLLLLWPPGAVMGAGVAIAYVLNGREWTRRKWVFLLVCGVAVLVLYRPWLKVLLSTGGDLLQFASQRSGRAGESASWQPAFAQGIRLLRAHLREGRPLLIFFGLAGVVVTPRAGLRRWFVPILLTLAVVTAWGETWLPKSQFSRMAIPLFFVAVAPAAMSISRVLRADDQRLCLVRALLVVLLALGAYNVPRIYENKGRAGYVVLDERIETLTGLVREHTPEGGRVLFGGKCVHAFGAGNVAYLPVLTGREMMADDYYGFAPGRIEYNYPPRRFRKSFALMQTFFDAYNVTHILSYHDRWRDYMRARPEYFTEIAALPFNHLTISFFAVRREPRPFLVGSGSLQAGFNRIDVAIDDAYEEIVLTYNWMEGLEASDGVELFRHVADEEIALIGARPGAVRNFTITYSNPDR